MFNPVRPAFTISLPRTDDQVHDGAGTKQVPAILLRIVELNEHSGGATAGVNRLLDVGDLGRQFGLQIGIGGKVPNVEAIFPFARAPIFSFCVLWAAVSG